MLNFYSLGQSAKRNLFLFCIILISIWNVSAAPYSTCSIGIIVNPPPDITITIKNSCDTNLFMAPATFSGNCSPILSSSTSNGITTLPTNGGTMNFPTGVYIVTYTLKDDCMTGIGKRKVTVFDKTPPEAVCAPTQTINLGSFGDAIAPAIQFNGGSFDNCNAVYFKVKRMSIPFNFSCSLAGNPNNNFDDAVRFCCADTAANPIQILLRVYDVPPPAGPVDDTLYTGHFADCMTFAEVYDKLAPVVNCPGNSFVLCGDDLDSVLHAETALITDNCGLASIDSTVVRNLNSCGYGTIERTYIATDIHGSKNSCKQIITVNPNSTFDGNDPNQLAWPPSKIIYTCRVDLNLAKIELTGKPILNDGVCDLVLTSYKDDVYSFSRGGICAKILRNWEVINWCIYNPKLKPNPKIPENGYYSYFQEIKMIDTVAPVFDSIPDLTIGISSPNCTGGLISLPSVHAIDCGVSYGLSYSYTVDYYNDGKIDVTGTGDNASGIFPMGNHTICYYAEDSCHNFGKYIAHLFVKDGKAPNPTVIHGLSTSLIQMQAGIMVMVNAKLFNISSSDNCTPNELLKFSYSDNMNDTIRTYNCDSIGLKTVYIYVWDQAGNYSVVRTFVVVLDNDNLCPHKFQTLKFSGLISSRNGTTIPDVSIGLEMNQHMMESKSNDKGFFSIDNIPMYSTAKLSTTFHQNYAEGISTADIVRIQNHILGKKSFENAYDLLAADVDQNGLITARDITYLRNLILGRTDELPNEKSYIFINKDYNFNFPLQPYDECKTQENQVFNQLDQDLNFNLLAIKIGDVNHSLNLNQTLSRSNAFASIYYIVKDNKIEIFSDFEGSIIGFQLGLDVTGLCKSNSNLNISDFGFIGNSNNYFCKDGRLTISTNYDQAVAISKNQLLFTIPLTDENIHCASLDLLKGFKQELIYTDGHNSSFNLVDKSLQINNQGFTLENIKTNMFNGIIDLSINVYEEQNILFQIVDLSGKMVYQRNFGTIPGLQSISFSKAELNLIPGTYFIRLEAKHNNEVLKFIMH